MSATSSLAAPALARPVARHVTPPAGAADAVRDARATLCVSGMVCAACAGSAEHALRRVDGVHAARVHFAARQAWVEWDPARTDLPALFDALRRAGYPAAPDTPVAARRLRRDERRAALWRLFVAVFCAMQVMMLAAPAYLAAPGDLAPDLHRLLDWGGWVMTLPVLLFSAGPFFSAAWRSLRVGRIGMDVPVALGLAVTFVASSAAAFDPGGPAGSEVYFDTLTMFVAFLLLGRWFELRLRHRAAETLEAATGALPETAWRLDAEGRAAAVAIASLCVGDRVRVPLGQAFPADGVLIEGRSEADEALLSGESSPVPKYPGCGVVGGSLNLGAPVVMRVERCGEDTRYEAILALTREAQGARPAAARWADRWAAPFLWSVLGLAALGAAVWSVIDPPRAVWVAVSVLIVTCPCALALATPSALLAAAQALARRGVLLRRIEALETLAGIDRLFLDKTGTLTLARPVLREIDRRAGAGGTEPAALLREAASLAAWSSHPLSRALGDAAALLPAEAAAAAAAASTVWREVREQPGAGLEARDAFGRCWRLGAARWVSAEPAEPAERAEPAEPDPAGLVVWFGCDGTARARFRFDETLGEDVLAALAALRADGVALTLLSGDDPQRVARLAQRLGFAPADALGGASPQRKLLEVERAQARGERVAMLGDGINDAPVLARADVALAMGEGALVARVQADAIVVSNRLADVVHARTLARRTLRVIRQNIAWAAGYNALCIPLALLGALPPWAAGLGMATSSLAVVLNSLRLQR